MVKVVLIGAGSTSFSPSVLASMVQTPELSGSTLALVDIDPGILHTLANVAERVVAQTGADLRIEAATDRREVLPGADFVIATFAAGGTHGWLLDVDIPARYGLAQPVGDSVGPGGLSRALRHVPVAVEIARDMAELCPRAYFFNYTNPMTALCRAVRREVPSIQSIGLCVGPELTRRAMASYLGLPAAALDYHGAGLNHCFWMLDCRYQGHDVYGLARDLARGGAAARRAGEALAALKRDDPQLRIADGAMGAHERPMRFCLELLDTLGYFPGPGDRHVTEFFPEFFPGGPAADPHYGLDRMPVSAIVEEKATLRTSLEAQASGAAPLDPKLIAGEVGHSEEVIAIITAIVRDQGLRLYGNLPNRGLVANLPPEAIVEVPLLLGAYGWRAFGVGDLPASILPYLTRRAATVELTVEAALTGDRAVALQALLADGWVRSVAEAHALFDDLLQAHADDLPQFRPALVAL
ncbi:MAG: hypothetical protein U0232_24445 [Thermomicrobiales bacterium]